MALCTSPILAYASGGRARSSSHEKEEILDVYGNETNFSRPDYAGECGVVAHRSARGLVQENLPAGTGASQSALSWPYGAFKDRLLLGTLRRADPSRFGEPFAMRFKDSHWMPDTFSR